MADLSDVTAYLAATVAGVVYPNGTSAASIAPVPPSTATQTFTKPMDVRIYEGWPVAEQLDLDIAGQVMAGTPPVPTPRSNGPCVNVSIFPQPGASASTYQTLDKTYTLAPAQIDLTVTVDGQAITITGTPAAGEFVTLVIDRESIYSETGTTAAAMLAALLTAVQVNYPAATLSGSVLTVPYNFQLDVRQGGVGLLGKVSHRQCQLIMVTVWAPDHNSRSVLAKAIDAAIKTNLVVAMPDTSDAKIVFNRTAQVDDYQNVSVYRRDLIYEVDYATLETFAGVTITSVTTTIAASEYNFPEPPPQVPAVT